MMGRRSRPAAVGYVRVAASEALADPEAFDLGGLSGRDQHLAIAEVAARDGLDLIAVVDEASVEATDIAGRTGFIQMLDVARDAGAGTVIVARLDRIGSDMVMQELLLGELARAGVALRSAQPADANQLVEPDPPRALVREAIAAVRPFDGDVRSARARWRRQNARGDEAVLAEIEHLAEQGADRGTLVGLLRRLRATGEP